MDEVDADAVLAAGRAAGLDFRRVDEHAVGLTFDETSTLEVVSRVLAAFGVDASRRRRRLPRRAAGRRDATDRFLGQAVFNRYHTEHEMLRYLRRLADRDLALDRTMIPLGSCTMKLNATTEMEPITWPEFADLHPFAPDDESAGLRELIGELEGWLAEITGYDAVSVQPNAGSQGEFAGLLAIRAYHRSRGDDRRTICLIPSSAHGTNAASAVMAGFEVVVVGTNGDGNVDVADLRDKLARAGDRVGAIMLTYPSTHGVFEEAIGEVCAAVHDAGGQVYVDGANLNALIGVARPGPVRRRRQPPQPPQDVLHPPRRRRTRGRPDRRAGAPRPVPPRSPAARRPTRASARSPRPRSGPPASCRSRGPTSRSMGAEGLTHATAVAICSANYVATRLADHYPVLYTGRTGRVAHECIVDLRAITRSTGVTVDDVAKRLMDYGFHAPTMSFPVAGTLMIEPTESETLAELDRFCDGDDRHPGRDRPIASGEWPLAESPLRLAPHTAEELIGAWDRPYDRELGAYPVAALRAAKYFPPVSRIDAAAGDRNLVCSCEPLEAYAIVPRGLTR